MMKKIFLIASLLFGSFIVFPISNFALDETSNDIRMYVGQVKAIDETSSDIRMYVGQVKTISVNNPTRIVISNPAVADVGNVSKSDVTLNPKSAGYTTLVIWDNFGENSYVVRVYTENMAEYKRRIDAILRKINFSDVSTRFEDEEARVYIMGNVKSAQDKERMMTALGDLKAKAVDLTSIREDDTIIEIDTQILELDQGAASDLGFTWPGSASFNITDAGKTVAGPFSQLFTFDKWTRAAQSFSWQVDFLVEEGKARILSRPRLSCQTGKEAKLVVGGEVPILSGSVGGGGTQASAAATNPGTVEYKDYGVVLNIKPVVDDMGRVNIKLKIEVSDIDEQVKTNYALAYSFFKRDAETQLILNDGETMALGGLIKKRDEETLRKFPFLADVPILGMFFRKRMTREGTNQNDRTDSELFITLTPHIVKKSTYGQKLPEQITKPQVPALAYYPNPNEASLDPAGRYSRVIQQRIMENVIYPQQARDAGFQGTTRLNIKLSYRGELLDAAVKKSSGYKVLDDNALAAAKSTAIYPPFPPAIPQEELWIEVPVSYQLE
jgi:pilus assembly protein CpaC